MMNNNINIGILAHVDAGKTTLSEGILFKQGSIRSMGRVDHGDAFLDTYHLERARGITIFSKQAVFSLGDFQVTLLDTPGHMDFSAEMERTLQVLDYAILVINGADGVTGYVKTLWSLLERYQVPVFLFVNKLDQVGVELQTVYESLRETLDEQIVLQDSSDADFHEKMALTDEAALEELLENGVLSSKTIARLVKERKVFPCFGGSALKMDGIDNFLNGMQSMMHPQTYGDAFGARVFKITRDDSGQRLTHMKITGGSLAVKTVMNEEKINQIRIYNGTKFTAVDKAEAGTICAVTGLDQSFVGQGLGFEAEGQKPVLDTVLNYQVVLEAGQDPYKAYEKLSQLSEEIPELHVVWGSSKQEIQIQLMGEVQAEIIQSIVKDRFDFNIQFGTPSILYRETIENTVEGVGHFEPLRHYAEVHFIMEPLPAGSGLVFDSCCKEDDFDRNWQRLVMGHLSERQHPGVLTGAPITDMKITLAAGKAHSKHTEGGDFRQATYRAIRQGLRKAKCRLLEPYYDFRLELPMELVGRAMSDIQQMSGTCNPPETLGTITILTGEAPVSAMNGYHRDVISYSKGQGRLYTVFKGYLPCHNQEEAVAASCYDADTDADNPTGSIFCSHGAGTYIPWDEVEKYMHIPGVLKETKEHTATFSRTYTSTSRQYTDEELMAVFQQTYGISKREKNGFKKSPKVIKGDAYFGNGPGPRVKSPLNNAAAEEILVIDGYNIIFAWEDLKEMSKLNLESARDMLIDILRNYQGYTGKKILVIFDAYKNPGSIGHKEKWDDLEVVYTKENETADQYIEKFVLENVKKYRITVATSDGLEQLLIFGQGALRMPARELRERVISASKEMREKYLGK